MNSAGRLKHCAVQEFHQGLCLNASWIGLGVDGSGGRWVQHDTYVGNVAEGFHQSGVHVLPTQAAVADTQGRYRYRGNMTFVHHPNEIGQARIDVGQLRGCAPVLFGWKVDDVLGAVELACLGDEHRSDGDMALFASLLVGGKGVRIAGLEFQRDSFTHDADAVDSVDQRLRVGQQQVAGAVCDQGLSLLGVRGRFDRIVAYRTDIAGPAVGQWAPDRNHLA